MKLTTLEGKGLFKGHTDELEKGLGLSIVMRITINHLLNIARRPNTLLITSMALTHWSLNNQRCEITWPRYMTKPGLNPRLGALNS